jgi:hypothetical protein
MKRPSPSRRSRRVQEEQPDQAFFDRADQIINLANEQLEVVNPGKVSASTLYAAARFNAWISATGWISGDELKAAKEETVDFFVEQYRAMLVENLDDYIDKFDAYMRPPN